MFGEDDDYCGFCGHILESRYLVAGALNGEMIDFNNREYMEISLSVCAECFSKILENVNGGITLAKKRARENKRLFK